MKTIRSVKCVYAIEREAWAIVLTFDEGEDKRFVMDPERIPMFLEAVDDATEALYDDAADEVVLSFEYADLSDYDDFDDEDDEDLDDEDEDDEDENEDDEDDDEDEKASSKKRKKRS